MTTPLTPLTPEELDALQRLAGVAIERVTQPIRCTCGKRQETQESAGYADGCEIHDDTIERQPSTVRIEAATLLRLLGQVKEQQGQLAFMRQWLNNLGLGDIAIDRQLDILRKEREL